MTVVLSILAVCSCVTAVASQTLTCNVSQSAGRWTYNIEGMPESTDKRCDFSWSNKTEHVIANQDEHYPFIDERSDSHLVSQQCLDEVLYEGSCWPKWEKLNCLCRAPCAKKPVVPPEVTPGPEHIIVGVDVAVAVTVTVFAVLLLAVLGWILKSRFSQRMRRDGTATAMNGQQVPLKDFPV